MELIVFCMLSWAGRKKKKLNLCEDVVSESMPTTLCTCNDEVLFCRWPRWPSVLEEWELQLSLSSHRTVRISLCVFIEKRKSTKWWKKNTHSLDENFNAPKLKANVVEQRFFWNWCRNWQLSCPMLNFWFLQNKCNNHITMIPIAQKMDKNIASSAMPTSHSNSAEVRDFATNFFFSLNFSSVGVPGTQVLMTLASSNWSAGVNTFFFFAQLLPNP